MKDYCAAHMVDVLLAHSYFLLLDPKQHAKMRPYPPLNTLHAATVLRNRGLEVAVFDAMLADDENDFRKALAEHQPKFVVLYEDNFNFLSKMCLLRMREAASDDGRDVTRGGLPGGGVRCRRHRPRRSVPRGRSRRRACSAKANTRCARSSTSGSPRILTARSRTFPGWRRCRMVCRCRVPIGPSNGTRTCSADRRGISSTSTPTGRLWQEHHGRFSLNMVVDARLPVSLQLVRQADLGSALRHALGTDTAAELASISTRRIAPDHVWFADDIFGLRSDWLDEFAEWLEQAGVRVPFTMQSRCDLMTDKAVDALARAGCEEVWLGAESGSQRVLDAMDKETTVDADPRRRAGVSASVASAPVSSSSSGTRARPGSTSSRPSPSWPKRCPTTSVSASAIPCRAHGSTRWSSSNSTTKRTGRVPATWR